MGAWILLNSHKNEEKFYYQNIAAFFQVDGVEVGFWHEQCRHVCGNLLSR